MMEDLQQAYSAYQQALYHLRDPQVLKSALYTLETEAHLDTGTQALVRNWHSL